ncbi:hypothetical protein J7K74_03770 [Candidatus Woesearchaeota archaeon]|nr:hypothetical protein [Candidatus Woesearchaeota archaeon]
MARVLPLLKTLKTGTEYQTEERELWVIKRIGTDATSDLTIKIDNKDVLTIRDLWAPIVKSTSNILGPFDLGDLYLVVPPATKIICGTATGNFVRIEGEKLILEPRESPPGDIMSRFYAQTQVFWELLEGSIDLGTDVVFGADSEQKILTVKPEFYHVYKLVGPVMVSVSGGTWNPGDFAVVLYKDGNPEENIYKAQPGPGIDVYYLPRPPTSSNESVFKFPEPIEITKGHYVEFYIRNVSGADKAPATGSAWTFTLSVLAIHQKPS